ncbi:MAG TPA: pentapeptide repeat-containing protein, partial [Exiguobacterium sp.]|nr:pentapeptide repeat-containing protein [Exiguobacterium sp.]
MKEIVIRLPELPKTLQPETFDQVEIDDPYLKGARYEKESMPSELTERIDAYQVCFQNVSFANLTFDRGSFEDIRFEQCDLTGCHFQETRFHRVSFVGCRM